LSIGFSYIPADNGNVDFPFCVGEMKSKNESGMMFMDVQKITLGLPAVESPGGCICRLDNQAHRYGFFRFYHLTS